MENIGLCDSDFIGKITIAIEMSDCDGNRVIRKCSSVFHKTLKKIISGKIQKLILNQDVDLSLGRIILNIGVIDYDLFEAQMADKLTIALEKALLVYFKAVPRFSSGKVSPHQARKRVENRVSTQSLSQVFVQPVTDTVHMERTAASEPSLITVVDHYLQQGDWPAILNQIPCLNGVAPPFIKQDLWSLIHHQPQQWLPMLAKHCLQPLGRRRLSVILSQAAQNVLCRLLTEDNSAPSIAAQLSHASMVTPTQLITAAEHYFKQQGVVAKDNPEATLIQPEWVPQKASSVASDLPRGIDKETPEPIFATTLKGNKLPVGSGTKPVAQPMGTDMTPISGEVLAISNAGILIFWPLLSTFFSVFGLQEKQVFIHQQAQVDAVCLLDWLIWGDDEISDKRLPLTKILCGLPIHFDAAWCAPAAEQKILICEWLEGIQEQLPAWRKMRLEDIRTLFLQRSGEITWSEVGMTVHVNPEAYDALINNWPWPMNMACFKWLQQPLTIRWL